VEYGGYSDFLLSVNYQLIIIMKITMQVSMYVLRAVSVPGLTPVQRVEVTAQGAVVFRRAGLGRKYSLLLYMAGLMSAEGGNVQVGSVLFLVPVKFLMCYCVVLVHGVRIPEARRCRWKI
jgi:hypothetical protein